MKGGTHNLRATSVFGRAPALVRLIASSMLIVLSVMSFGQGSQTPASVPAARQANNVAILTIKGEINETTARSIARRIDLAERAGANAMVIELDTPGGRLDAVLAICNAIRASSISNTVAWVNRDAYSGGAIIAIACREIVVNDPSTLGDAIPIARSMIGALNALPETERQKALAPLIAELVSSARRNGYDELLVQGIASRGVELWLVENKETGRRVCITRDEYSLVFGEEPTTGAPGLASAPTAAPVEAAPGEKGVMDQLQKFIDQPQRRPSRQREAGQASKVEENLPGSANKFIPGAPEMEAISGRVSGQLELPPARPVFTSADRGKWTFVEYVSTGTGPFVFKADQMLHYRLATKVVKNDDELKDHFGAKNLLRLDQSWSEGLVAVLTWFPVRGLLIAIFLIALFIEMTHPGLVAPGGIAAAALVALIAPPLLINMANWWEIAAILGGIVLIVLEIFVLPGFGLPGILGLLLLFGGLIGTFVPAGSFFPDSAQSRNDMLYGVATMVMAVVTSGIAMYFISKNFKTLPLFGKLVLKDPGKSEDSGEDMLSAMAITTGPLKKGMVGVALTPLRPAGRIELPGGRIVDAVAEMGFIPTGAKVRITTVSDFRVGVERAEA